MPSKCAVRADPLVGRIGHVLPLQFERGAVIDVVADVLLVGEDLVDGAFRPGPAEICKHALGVEQRGDF